MHQSLAFALALAYASTGLAVPAVLPAPGKRSTNPCPEIEPAEGSEANVGYFNGQPGGCPYKNKLNADGTCTAFDANSASFFCTAYCEVKNTYFYGQEVPFNQFSSCRANEPCTFTSTESLTITQTFAFNAGISLSKRNSETNDTSVHERAVSELIEREDDAAPIKIGFDLGASYSFSTATQTSTGLALSRPTDKVADCGYWTFVPEFWTSCGSISTADLGQSSYYSSDPTCGDVKSTTGNYCNTYPYLDSNGNQAGQTIFVLLDCNTSKLLSLDQQDPIYQQPGVSATQNYQNSGKWQS